MSQIETNGNREAPGSARPYEAGDEERIVPLLDAVFNGWPPFDLVHSPLDYWRWRYLDFPSKPGLIIVYQVDDEIVGCSHASRLHMKIGDRLYSGCLGGDVAILKAYRGHGIAGTMFKLAARLRKESGIWFTYYETRNTRLLRSFKKTDYRLPFQSRHLVRVKDINLHLKRQQHAKRWLKSCIFRSLKALNQLVYLQLRSEGSRDLKLSEIATFDARFDVFRDQVAKDYSLIIQRDRHYLNWRYCDTRGGDYLVKCAEDAEGVQGYIVLRIDFKDKNYPIAYIVDLLCKTDRQAAAKALIADSLSYFDQQGVPAVHCLVPKKHPYRKLLAAHGFVDTLERTIVFLRANMPMEEEMAALKFIGPGQAYYSFGDIDTI